MKPINFDKDYAALVAEMNKKMYDKNTNRKVISDGVHTPEKYFSNDIRLAWMLKEAYDENGGGWQYKELFDEEDLYEAQFKKGHKTTWHPIIYTSHGILHGFKQWDDMEYIRDNRELAKIVREVAFINAQKLPSLVGTRTNMDDIHTSINKYGDLLLKQIELLKPNVFIFANTFDAYKTLLDFNDVELIQNGSCSYFVRDEQLFINAYHPAQTQVGGKAYTNDIVEVVKNWFNRR
jgi:hypothetical protein